MAAGGVDQRTQPWGWKAGKMRDSVGRPEAAANFTTRDTSSVRGSCFGEREVVCPDGSRGLLGNAAVFRWDSTVHAWVGWKLLRTSEGAVLREFRSCETE